LILWRRARGGGVRIGSASIVFFVARRIAHQGETLRYCIMWTDVILSIVMSDTDMAHMTFIGRKSALSSAAGATRRRRWAPQRSWMAARLFRKHFQRHAFAANVIAAL